ncbi:MAG: hypothetical protein M3020_13365 [Myxococcota bacterium]|jgi:hypothetical protein|nr:hypothetical protein [Myxococcota bacterium]
MTPGPFSPLVCAALLTLMSACSSSDDTVDGATSADCNQLENRAPRIREEVFPDMGAVPTANGGEIQSGTYHLVKASFFGASPTCAPQFRKLTLKVEAQSNRAGRMEYSLGEAPNDTAPIRDEHVSSTYETTGTSIAERATCPLVGDAPLYSYTASPTSLTFIVPRGSCGTYVVQLDQV